MRTHTHKCTACYRQPTGTYLRGDDDGVLGGRPRTLAHVWVDLVMPPLAALLGLAAGQEGCDVRPLLCAVLPNQQLYTWVGERDKHSRVVHAI